MAEQVNVRPETKELLRKICAKEGGRSMMDVIHAALVVYAMNMELVSTGAEEAEMLANTIAQGFNELLLPVVRVAAKIAAELQWTNKQQQLQQLARMEGTDLEVIDYSEVPQLYGVDGVGGKPAIRDKPLEKGGEQ